VTDTKSIRKSKKKTVLLILSGALLIFGLFLTYRAVRINDAKSRLAEILRQNEYILEAEPENSWLYFQLMGNVAVCKIRYTSDEFEVVGYIAVPPDFDKKEYSVLIYNRGGANLSLLDGGIDLNRYVNLGYVVLASQYRGYEGGTGTDMYGGDDISDVIRLIDISEELDFTKKSGVYMVGVSRGGMMTYIACRMDDRIKAAAVLVGVSDMKAFYLEHDAGGAQLRRYIGQLFGGSPADLPEPYLERSAVLWADEIDVPLLIIHGGESDLNVRTSQAIGMAEKLEECGKEYKLVIYEDMGHNFVKYYVPIFKEIEQWFSAYE